MLFVQFRGQAAKLSILLLALALFGFAASHGRAAAEETIHLSDAKARPTLPTSISGVVYLTIVNQGPADDTLNSVFASVASSAAMHLTAIENGVTTMTDVRTLPVKAGETVRFAPGGLHIMLIGMKRQLQAGDSFPITLNFAQAGPVTATVAVGPIAPTAREPIAPTVHDMNAMPGMRM